MFDLGLKLSASDAPEVYIRGISGVKFKFALRANSILSLFLMHKLLF